jgi:hypothetical protein
MDHSGSVFRKFSVISCRNSLTDEKSIPATPLSAHGMHISGYCPKAKQPMAVWFQCRN